MRKYMDVISGLFFLLLAIALYAGSYSIKTFSDTAYGVAFLPRVVALLMGGISLIVIAGGYRKARGAPAMSGFPITRGFVLTIILIFLYMLAMSTLGFIIASFAYITAQIYVLSNFDKKQLYLGASLALVFSVGIYFLFTRVIYIMLPPGIFG